jgi:hypothetical protein
VKSKAWEGLNVRKELRNRFLAVAAFASIAGVGTAVAAGAFQRITVDRLILGAATTTDKTLEFDTGEGVSANGRIVAKDDAIWDVDAAIVSLINPKSTAVQPALRLREASTNGANYIGLQAPASVAADVTLTLPSSAPGANSSFLSASTAGAMSWISCATSTTVLHGGASPSCAQVGLTNEVTGILPLANGGTGAGTKAAAFDALSPMTTAADLIVGGTSGTGTRLAAGSANQVLGMNSGATAHEYKSFATGTSGANFTVAHSANTITFNLPDAGTASRGVVSVLSQNFHGNKTFDNAVTISETSGGVGNVPHNCTTRSNSCGSVATCTLTCSAGERVMGGGGTCGTSSIRYSFPSTDSAWRVDCSATDTTSTYGICCTY